MTPKVMTPELRHEELARQWCIWNGQKGTVKQVEKVKARQNAETLDRMMRARGIFVIAVGSEF